METYSTNYEFEPELLQSRPRSVKYLPERYGRAGMIKWFFILPGICFMAGPLFRLMLIVHEIVKGGWNIHRLEIQQALLEFFPDACLNLLVSIAISCAISAILLYVPNRHRRLVSEGLAVKGVVVENRIVNLRTQGHELTIAYCLEGQEHRIRFGVHPDFYQTMPVGSELTLLVDDKAPEQDNAIIYATSCFQASAESDHGKLIS
jgi:hypothetical protein